VSGCVACQEFFRTSNQLDSALRRAATVSVTAPSSHLEQQIVTALRRSTRSHAPARKARPRFFGGANSLWSASAAAAVLAGAVVFLSRDRVDARRITAPEVVAMADTVKTLSNEFIGSVLPSAGAMVANNPLQQELDSIFSDAQSALGFLKMNFLPASDQPLPRSG
jgi:hypothetical protein